MAVDLKVSFSNSLYRKVAWPLAVELLSCEEHRTTLMRSQHWLRQWLDAVRQQAIPWAKVDPNLCDHMMSLGHNKLRHKHNIAYSTALTRAEQTSQVELSNYRQVSNIRRTLTGNQIVDHSDVVGASPVGAAPTTSSFST